MSDFTTMIPRSWLTANVAPFIERDVRQFTQVQDLETFQRFVRLCADRKGQLLNLSSLATECGITHNTAKVWKAILEASYLVFLLCPHHANFNKRLVKTPKLYFYDTGLVSWLLGIQIPEQLAAHPLRGNIFVTLIVSELLLNPIATDRQNHPSRSGATVPATKSISSLIREENCCPLKSNPVAP